MTIHVEFLPLVIHNIFYNIENCEIVHFVTDVLGEHIHNHYYKMYRTITHARTSVSLPLSVSVCLSLCLSVSLPLSVSRPSLCVPLSLSNLSVSVCLNLSASLSLSLCLSVSLSVTLSLPHPNTQHIAHLCGTLARLVTDTRLFLAMTSWLSPLWNLARTGHRYTFIPGHDVLAITFVEPCPDWSQIHVYSWPWRPGYHLWGTLPWLVTDTRLFLAMTSWLSPLWNLAQTGHRYTFIPGHDVLAITFEEPCPDWSQIHVYSWPWRPGYHLCGTLPWLVTDTRVFLAMTSWLSPLWNLGQDWSQIHVYSWSWLLGYHLCGTLPRLVTDTRLFLAMTSWLSPLWNLSQTGHRYTFIPGHDVLAITFVDLCGTFPRLVTDTRLFLAMTSWLSPLWNLALTGHRYTFIPGHDVLAITFVEPCPDWSQIHVYSWPWRLGYHLCGTLPWLVTDTRLFLAMTSWLSPLWNLGQTGHRYTFIPGHDVLAITFEEPCPDWSQIHVYSWPWRLGYHLWGTLPWLVTDTRLFLAMTSWLSPLRNLALTDVHVYSWPWRLGYHLCGTLPWLVTDTRLFLAMTSWLSPLRNLALTGHRYTFIPGHDVLAITFVGPWPDWSQIHVYSWPWRLGYHLCGTLARLVTDTRLFLAMTSWLSPLWNLAQTGHRYTFIPGHDVLAITFVEPCPDWSQIHVYSWPWRLGYHLCGTLPWLVTDTRLFLAMTSWLSLPPTWSLLVVYSACVPSSEPPLLTIPLIARVNTTWNTPGISLQTLTPDHATSFARLNEVRSGHCHARLAWN